MPRVLICEDSAVYAAALKLALEYDGGIRVAAVCRSAEEAIAALPRVRPDLMTMDIELPGMDGLAAVEEIMSSRPLPILVLSSHVGPGSGKAAAMLAAGALDAVAKDDLDLRAPAGAIGALLRHRVTVLSRARVIRHPRARLRSGSAPLAAPATARPAGRWVSVIGVCASAGGPQALTELLHELPAAYPVPILIVQHLTAGFTAALSSWLHEAVRLPVTVATDDAPARPGAWIAPDGAHLTLTAAGRLSLDRRTAAGPHRPSGDMLFASIAEVAGPRGVAVVLSGMGRDGADGAATLRRRGGMVIAQDQASAAVAGMPDAVIGRGADLVLPPAEIAAFLRELRAEPITSGG